MAQFSWPFENIDTSETQYSLLFKHFQDNGVLGSPASAEALVVATSTGMGLTVAPGFAIVRGFAYQNTSAVALTIGTSAVLPRIDTILLRLDPVTNSIVVAVKAGTPNASPSAPALTQTDDGVYEMPLANILVPGSAAALSPSNLTDRRAFLGGQVGSWFTASRPTNAQVGRMGYNNTLGRYEYWTGTAWDTALPIDFIIPNGSVTDAMLAVPGGRYKSSTVTASTAFSVTTADLGRLIYTSAATAVTVTLQAGLVAGDRVDIYQNGAGQITFAPGAGVNLASRGNKLKSAGQYAAVTVLSLGGNEYRLIGDLVA